jgi:hypothetical protein
MKKNLKSPGMWFLLQVIILAVLVATVDQSIHPKVVSIPFWTLIAYTVIWLLVDTYKSKTNGKFTIRKGKHYSFHLPKLWFGRKSHKLRFKLDANCWYSFDGEDANDINKLWGVSFGHHHTNSFRLGWRPSKFVIGEIELFHYVYDSGKVEWDFIGTFTTNDWVDVDIEVGGGYVKSTFNGRVYLYIYDEANPKFGYYLFPYFGGNRTAPRDMNIYLKAS